MQNIHTEIPSWGLDRLLIKLLHPDLFTPPGRMTRISPVPEIKMPIVCVSRVRSSPKSNACPPEKANAPSDGIKTKPKPDHRHEYIMNKMILMVPHNFASQFQLETSDEQGTKDHLLLRRIGKPCALDVAMHVPCKLLSPTGSTIHSPLSTGSHDKAKTAASHLQPSDPGRTWAKQHHCGSPQAYDQLLCQNTRPRSCHPGQHSQGGVIAVTKAE